jgi:extradiol dioxygenase family protein
MPQPLHFAFFVRDLEPTRRFLLDPSGNALVFKSFRNSAHVFTA